MTLFLELFAAGMVTILLPCILPLVPIVLGVSVAGKSKLRPLFTILGMVLSFVAFTFVLLTLLNQFVELADIIRISTYYMLLLFGIGFAIHLRQIQWIGAVLGALFFIDKGWAYVIVAAILGIIAMEVGGRVAGSIQNLGSEAQMKVRSEFGADAPLSALLIGMTLGLVWVPCAGPALGLALTLVRDEPGLKAFAALSAYALGTAVPLLIIAYGGQWAVHSARMLNKYTGIIKQISGVILIVTAVALTFGQFEKFQVWITNHAPFGDFGTSLENKIFNTEPTTTSSSASSTSTMTLPVLPTITRAPEFTDLGPWHNSEPFTLASLKGKVVLVDFWTYSCINCIRTLPYIQGYWEKYEKTGKFVLLGVHTPEFTFEKSEKNVAMALKEHGLTYPVAQDNDFGTWSAFANRYWPAKYLIDANGYIRYTHFGEGNYADTDLAIASLLKEAGVTVTDAGEVASEAAKGGGNTTGETYLSSRSWPAFGNSQGDPTDSAVTYTAPSKLELHKYYLVGKWQLVDDEAQTLMSDTGEIRMKFLGGETNLVMGLADGAKPVQATVTVDGKPGTSFTIDRHDLFNLFKGDYGEHEVVLKLQGTGAQGFAFTFGG